MYNIEAALHCWGASGITDVDMDKITTLRKKVIKSNTSAS